MYKPSVLPTHHLHQSGGEPEKRDPAPPITGYQLAGQPGGWRTGPEQLKGGERKENLSVREGGGVHVT